MLALGRLLRLSLAPSALADVAAGIMFASRGHWPAGAAPFCLMASSACVYHGAMAINDWRDREHDARTRPARPIPSGAVSAGSALGIGAALLILGPLIALQNSVQASLWSLGLGALALAYDLGGRGPWLGPMMLALCRAGNLGLGLFFATGVFAHSIPAREAVLPMILYGWFVLRVSQLGRMEDGEDVARSAARPRALLSSAAMIFLFLPMLPPFAEQAHTLGGRLVCAAIALSAAFGLFRTAYSPLEWTRSDVERAMGMCLRRFLTFTASLAALSWRPPAFDGLVVAAAILAGYPLASRLRRVFPPS